MWSGLGFAHFNTETKYMFRGLRDYLDVTEKILTSLSPIETGSFGPYKLNQPRQKINSCCVYWKTEIICKMSELY